MVQQLRKIYMFLYRSFGFVMLFCISMVIVTFLSLMIFFMQNSNWIAPTVLSPTSDKMLAFQASLMTETQIQSSIVIQLETSKRAVESLTKQRAGLASYMEGLKSAVKHETQTTQRFSVQKTEQFKGNTTLAKTMLQSEAEVQEQLKAGLLTRAEAAQALVSIAQFRSLNSDTEMAADQLSRHQSTLSGRPEAVDGLAAKRQLVDLEAQLNAIDDGIAVQMKTVVEAEAALKKAKSITETLDDAAYMNVLRNGGGNMAFLAYDNASQAKIGAPVYDCYLTIFACHQVGTIKKVYADEQIVDFPIFNVRFSRTVRGTLIELDLSDKAAMKSPILFIGFKPLFI
jgi:hypothetical protein